MGGAAKMASYVSSWFPPPPTAPDHPAVSFLHDPEPTGVFSNSKANIDSPSWWNPVLRYDVVSNSATPYSASKTSHYSDVRVLPPPPPYIPGEFEAYTGNLEHGNSEMEAEVQVTSSSGPSPQPVFQAGELSEHEYISEFGHEERETEEEAIPHYSFPSQGFWESPVVFASAGPMRPSSRWLEADLKYPSFSGPVAPGRLSHFHSKYETGGNYWDEVGYDRFYYPKD